MTYEIYVFRTKNDINPIEQKEFTSYRKAKQAAKELAQRPYAKMVFIYGFEKIKDEDLKF